MSCAKQSALLLMNSTLKMSCEQIVIMLWIVIESFVGHLVLRVSQLMHTPCIYFNKNRKFI